MQASALATSPFFSSSLLLFFASRRYSSAFLRFAFTASSTYSHEKVAWSTYVSDTI